MLSSKPKDIRARAKKLPPVVVPKGGKYVGRTISKDGFINNQNRTTDSRGRSTNTFIAIDPKTGQSKIVESTPENIQKIDTGRRQVVAKRTPITRQELIESILKKQGKDVKKTDRGLEWTDRGKRYFTRDGNLVSVPKNQDTSKLKIDFGRVSRVENIRMATARAKKETKRLNELSNKKLQKEIREQEEKSRLFGKGNLKYIMQPYKDKSLSRFQQSKESKNRFNEASQKFFKRGIDTSVDTSTTVKGYARARGGWNKLTKNEKGAVAVAAVVNAIFKGSRGAYSALYSLSQPIQTIKELPEMFKKKTWKDLGVEFAKDPVGTTAEFVGGALVYEQVFAKLGKAVGKTKVGKAINKPFAIVERKIKVKVSNTVNKIKTNLKKALPKKEYFKIAKKLNKNAITNKIMVKNGLKFDRTKTTRLKYSETQSRMANNIVADIDARALMEAKIKVRSAKQFKNRATKLAKERGLSNSQTKAIKKTTNTNLKKAQLEYNKAFKKFTQSGKKLSNKDLKAIKNKMKKPSSKIKISAELKPKLKTILEKGKFATKRLSKKAITKARADISEFVGIRSLGADLKVINSNLIKPLTKIAKSGINKINISIKKGIMPISKGIKSMNIILGKFGLRIKLLKIKGKIASYKYLINPIKKKYSSIISRVVTGKNKTVFYLKAKATKGLISAIKRFNKISPVELKVYIRTKNGNMYFLNGNKLKPQNTFQLKSAIGRKARFSELVKKMRKAELAKQFEKLTKVDRIKAAKELVIEWKLGNIDFNKLPSSVRKTIRKGLKSGKLKITKEQAKKIKQDKSFKRQLLESEIRAIEKENKIYKTKQKIRLEKRKAILKRKQKTMQNQLKKNRQKLVYEIKNVNGKPEIIPKIVADLRARKGDVVVSATGKILKGKKYILKENLYRAAYKIIKDSIKKDLGGAFTSSKVFRKQFRRAYKQLNLNKSREIGTWIKNQASKNTKKVTTTSKKTIQASKKKFNAIKKRTNTQVEKFNKASQGQQSVLLQQVKKDIKNSKGKGRTSERISKYKTRRKQVLKAASKSKGKLRQSYTLAGGVYSLLLAGTVYRNRINSIIGAVTKQEQNIVTKQQIKEIQKPAVSNKIDNTVIQAITQKPAIKQIVAITSLLTLGGATALLRGLPRVTAINNSNLGRSLKRYKSALLKYTKSKQYVYTPDIAALIYGQIATAKQKIKLLKIGRIFSGIERRLKTR